ncbi:36.4 kDa proline-rich protein [Platanthera guangdongensis]|uniref:36.4 kDa proline-rich protein n=1 Tax=Platanthera guangdongensis TaxID=2320717 RepID=A0ABR2MZF3_9ASPA
MRGACKHGVQHYVSVAQDAKNRATLPPGNSHASSVPVATQDMRQLPHKIYWRIIRFSIVRNKEISRGSGRKYGCIYSSEEWGRENPNAKPASPLQAVKKEMTALDQAQQEPQSHAIWLNLLNSTQNNQNNTNHRREIPSQPMLRHIKDFFPFPPAKKDASVFHHHLRLPPPAGGIDVAAARRRLYLLLPASPPPPHPPPSEPQDTGAQSPAGGRRRATGIHPRPPPPPAKCSLDILKLELCLDVLGGLVNLGFAPVQSYCCPVIQGLLELEAAACLCAAINLKLLNLNIYIPLALEVLITCGKDPPLGYFCPLIRG